MLTYIVYTSTHGIRYIRSKNKERKTRPTPFKLRNIFLINKIRLTKSSC